MISCSKWGIASVDFDGWKEVWFLSQRTFCCQNTRNLREGKILSRWTQNYGELYVTNKMECSSVLFRGGGENWTTSGFSGLLGISMRVGIGSQVPWCGFSLRCRRRSLSCPRHLSCPRLSEHPLLEQKWNALCCSFRRCFIYFASCLVSLTPTLCIVAALRLTGGFY